MDRLPRLSQFAWKLREVSRRLWVRAALISALGLVAPALSPWLNVLIPQDFLARIGRAEARELLDILANSMLSVTTFSLTIMVTAHFFASQQVTPRAHRILRQDTRTQTVLATFVGGFVFALASIVLIQTGMLGEDDLATVYLFTLLVAALIIIAILRWIAHLSGLGSMEETTRRVEDAAREAIGFRNGAPFMGGRPLAPGALPASLHGVAAPVSGFVQHVDTARLAERAGQRGARAWLMVRPGDWRRQGEPLLLHDAGSQDSGLEESLAECITLGDTRTFVQDVEFGLMTMAEIAQRALSPGINDPRTAADVIARLVNLADAMAPETPPPVQEAPAAPNVFAAPLDVGRALEAAFDPIARDGAGVIEVQMHIQSALGYLVTHRDPQVARAARLLSRRALGYAEGAIPLAEDLKRLAALAPATRPARHRDVPDGPPRDGIDTDAPGGAEGRGAG